MNADDAKIVEEVKVERLQAENAKLRDAIDATLVWLRHGSLHQSDPPHDILREALDRCEEETT